MQYISRYNALIEEYYLDIVHDLPIRNQSSTIDLKCVLAKE